MQKITIKNPQLLEFTTPDGELCTGGNQDWYDDHWRQMSGCGPTAASNIIWYQAHSRAELGALCEAGSGDYADFRTLMDTMFGHITPGRGGVHSSNLFIPGLLEYCQSRGVPMEADRLDIRRMPRNAPKVEEIREFLVRWLEKDCAVAFLNLSNGALKLPDSWHWVTIISIEPESMTALISDEGRTYEADMGKWIETSVLGGALVALHTP